MHVSTAVLGVGSWASVDESRLAGKRSFPRFEMTSWIGVAMMPPGNFLVE